MIMSKKIIGGVLAIVALGVATAVWFYFSYWRIAVVPKTADTPVYVYLPDGLQYPQLLDSLRSQANLQHPDVFDFFARRMKYDQYKIHGGRYELQPGWSAVQLVRHLRSGNQSAVQLVLNNEREWYNVAAKASRFIQPDSLALVAVMSDSDLLDSIGYDQQNLMAVFIPNTYEFFWNTTPKGFLLRMLRERNRFWDQNGRRDKARALGLSENEVYTLASIVEKETQANSEKARIAGVYLNRLNDGWPLQADPTAVFATRDFDAKRVLYYHINFDSPYNTYKYKGLPPGPISIASIASIDAVLNAEQHDYMFFCARGDETGLHNFAATIDGHARNISIYKQNLAYRGLQ
jgi:UPF0755 protein